MNNRLKIIGIALFIMSCETVVNIDIPLEKPKLVVNSLFSPDSVWQVQVSRSRHILNDLPFAKVDDAKVTVYDAHDNPVAVLSNKGEGVYRGDASPIQGNFYTLKVETTTEHNTLAVGQIPIPVPITSVDLDTASMQYYGQDIEVAVNFNDPGAEKNYYLLKILQEGYYLDYYTKDTVSYRSEVNFTPIDPSYENDYDSRQGMLFNDNFFNGKSYAFLLKLNSYALAPDNEYGASSVTVILYSVSEEYYNYFATKNLQDYTSGDPFAQPVQVFSNIENGFGIFAGYSASTVRLK